MSKNNNQNSSAGVAVGAMTGGLLLPALAFAITASGPIAGVCFGIGILGGGLGGKKIGALIEDDSSGSKWIEDKHR